MEMQSIYNLDDVFYDVNVGAGTPAAYTVNNIITSAVGHKILYDLRNVTTGRIITKSEAQVQEDIDNGKWVRTIDAVRANLNAKVEQSIADLEKARTKFLKEKLNGTLNNKKRKAETSIESMKEKIGGPYSEWVTEDDTLKDLKKMELYNKINKHWASWAGQQDEDHH